tara:strand:- start:32 stop:610 length:579 start_codon:yes stop_codon:yes gene_type:complete
MSAPLQVEYRDIETLIPYINNARIHSDEQIAQIAASIKEFGWTQPVLVDGNNGIIAGHGRVRAARKLGQVDIPVIELEGLSESQRYAYILTDNRLAENATWDSTLLEAEIDKLKPLNFDISLLGWGAEGPFVTAFPEYEDVTEEEEEVVLERTEITIEINSEDYDELTNLFAYWRKQGKDLGQLLIDLLKAG